ncbi:MAG: BatA domain-containing protein [Candidatus Hinthialibacter antarcticus]|nr:BatA domain-containing protein [Candidatus Hinthialibacter antarcticus]
MFTFANPFLLWAFPILALPWIFRRRREDQIQRVDFPLIRFLLEAKEKDFINPQLQELLLLILRTLLLAMILLALAGPRWQTSGAGARLWSWLPFASALQQQIAVIDSSYSMGYDDGDAQWMPRANDAWNNVKQSLGGLALRTYRWDAASVGASAAAALNPLSRAEIDLLFEETPTANGASSIDLFASLRSQLNSGERIVIITDGQRLPWQSLLDGPVPPSSVPPCIVAVVGTEPAVNLWCDIDAISLPPWGVAGWESFTGYTGAIGWQETVNGGLTVTRVDADEDVLQNDVSFPGNTSGVQRVPFSFTASAGDLVAIKTNEETYASQWRIQIEPDDPLPIDNQLEFQVPIQTQFNIVLAADETAPSSSLAVLRASVKPDDTQTGPIQIHYAPTSLEALSPDDDWLVLNPAWRTEWSAAETSLVIEFAKQGGAVLVMTGGEVPQGAWAEFLGELGWEWLPENTEAQAGSITVSSIETLGDALSVWPKSAWDDWTPKQHGALTRSEAQPTTAYEYGAATAHSLAGFTLGQGRIWLLNAPLSTNQGALLSPLFPALMWELAKDAARVTRQENWTPPQRRFESDLTMLTQDERQQLQARYGIEFVDLDSINDALGKMQGGFDLRIVLIFICLLLALLESWLANRLASL